jgi:phage repressor protein C with HTH and peptisase S24 domain
VYYIDMMKLSERLSSLGPNNVELAEIAGVSKQSVTNWIARDSISKKGAERLAKHFGVSMEWLLTGDNIETGKTERSNVIWQGGINEVAQEYSYVDEVLIPYFKEVSLSAGGGDFLQLETNGRTKKFAKTELKALGVDISNSACATVHGDSMTPVLPHGSSVGVDMSDTKVKDGKMYAIDRGGMLYIKRLYKEANNGLRIFSYNKEEYPEERLTEEQVKRIKIIGRVFWYSALV